MKDESASNGHPGLAAVPRDARPATVDDITEAVADARRRITDPRHKLSAFVSADVGAHYGRFAEVVDRLRLEGVADIAMDTQPTTIEEPGS